MKRTGIYLLVIVVATLGLLAVVRENHASAAGAAFPDLIELAPADSTMVAYADLAALRQSPLVQQLTSLAQPPQTDSDYTAFVSATGFDYQRDLDRVMVTMNSANPDKALVLAEGRFDQEKIEQYALRTGKLEQENGRAVYVEPSTTASGKSIHFAFPSADRIAISIGGALPAAFSTNSPSTIDPGMRDRLSRVSGAPIFGVFNSSGLAKNAAGSPGMSQALTAQLAALRWVSLAVQPDGGNVLLSAEGECDKAEQAQGIAGTLELLRAVARGAIADPKSRGQIPADSVVAAGKLLDSLKITTDSTHVRLMMSLTPDLLRFPRPTAPVAPLAPAIH